MKSKAVLFQKEIRMETCWLILHSILVTHYWTALMDPAKQASDNMQSEVSGRLGTNLRHKEPRERERVQSACNIAL